MASRERVSALPSKRQKRIRLCRLEQDVLLLTHRELDDAFGREIARVEDHLLVTHGSIIDTKSAALDLAARLAVRCDEAGLDEHRQDADAGLKFAARNFHRRRLGDV